MTGELPKASLLPGPIPAEEYGMLWRQSIAPYFDARPVNSAAHLRSPPRMHQFHLGSGIFIDSEFSAQTFTRDRRWMARYDDVDHVALQVLTQGTNRVANGAQHYVEKPGNVFSLNMAYPIDAVSEDCRVLSLVLQRDLLAQEAPYLLSLCGALFSEDSTGSRLLVDHMISLGNNLPSARAGEAPMIMRSTLGLIDSLVLHGDMESDAAKTASFAAVCRHIEQHLDDFDLDVDKICRHFRCSRATLYRLFKSQGGLGKYIQRRRLVGCLRAITSPRAKHRRVYDIALDFGFASASRFSSLFHAHFGMTPSQAREAGLAHSGAGQAPPPPREAGDNTADLMWQWAKTLASSPAP